MIWDTSHTLMFLKPQFILDSVTRLMDNCLKSRLSNSPIKQDDISFIYWCPLHSYTVMPIFRKLLISSWAARGYKSTLELLFRLSDLPYRASYSSYLFFVSGQIVAKSVLSVFERTSLHLNGRSPTAYGYQFIWFPKDRIPYSAV